MAQVGAYISTMILGEDVNLASIDDGNPARPNALPSASVSDQASNDGAHNEHSRTDKGRAYYPISIEGRTILIEQLQIRNAAHFRTVKSHVDQIKQFESGFSAILRKSLGKLREMHTATKEILRYEEKDTAAISMLVERYLPAPLTTTSQSSAAKRPTRMASKLSTATAASHLRKMPTKTRPTPASREGSFSKKQVILSRASKDMLSSDLGSNTPSETDVITNVVMESSRETTAE